MNKTLESLLQHPHILTSLTIDLLTLSSKHIGRTNYHQFQILVTFIAFQIQINLLFQKNTVNRIKVGLGAWRYQSKLTLNFF